MAARPSPRREAVEGALTTNSRTKHGESLTFPVVDDDTTNRLVLSAMLDHAGHRSIQATHGAEVLEAFANEHPDMVLLDIMMPVLDGFETARRSGHCGR